MKYNFKSNKKRNLMIPILISTLMTVLAWTPQVSKANLDSLLSKVLKDKNVQTQQEKDREAQFLLAKDKQKELLTQAQAELQKLEGETSRLTQQFDKNEKELTVLEEKLTQASGNLGEMFGVVKQISGDLSSHLENSVVSSQYKNRHEFVQKLAARKALPNTSELKQLWHEILKETIESGKVEKFNTEVVQADGKTKIKEVTRVGSFNLFSGGKYLNYQPETSQIVELARQPEGKYLGFLEDFEESTVPEILPMGVDPSRGVLLGMLVNAPSFMERFHQGGLVGYIITILLFVGVIIVGERFYVLKKEKDKIMAQLGHSHIDESNALGRLLKVFEENKTESLENLELKLDESIMKSLPPIEKGIGTLKLLAAIGPLMGLLGTVTGMITTFQSITMFGAGDPKLMAGGISTALITTVQGLVCAIPMLLLHGYISGKSKEIVQILTEQSVGLIAEKKGK